MQLVWAKDRQSLIYYNWYFFFASQPDKGDSSLWDWLRDPPFGRWVSMSSIHGACRNLTGNLYSVYSNLFKKVLSQRRICQLTNRAMVSCSLVVMEVMTARLRSWIQRTKISYFCHWGSVDPQWQSEEHRASLLWEEWAEVAQTSFQMPPWRGVSSWGFTGRRPQRSRRHASGTTMGLTWEWLGISQKLS